MAKNDGGNDREERPTTSLPLGDVTRVDKSGATWKRDQENTKVPKDPPKKVKG